MASVVQCQTCQKQYKVGPEMAGRRFRCNVCGAISVVPYPTAIEPQESPPGQWEAAQQQWGQQPAAPQPPPQWSAAPPPLPVPAVPMQGAYPGQYQYPYPPGVASYPMRQRPASSGNARTIAIVVAVIILLAGIGGIVGYLQNPGMALFMSDSTIQSKLAGTWQISHPASGTLTGTISFDGNGRYHFDMSSPTKNASYGGTYELIDHRITLILPGPQFGTTSPAGTRLPYGHVKEITDTTLVLGTKNGNEIYTRVSTSMNRP